MLGYIISYLLGSINFSYVIGKLLKIDISKYGDANLGAVNLYYAYTGRHRFLVFLLAAFLDGLKAFIPTIIFGPLAGAFAVVGHCFSIFSIIKTKKVPSGVGLASSIGWALATDYKILALSIPYLIVFFLPFVKVFRKERGHIAAAVSYPFIALTYYAIFHKYLIPMYIIAFSCSYARVLRCLQLVRS